MNLSSFESKLYVANLEPTPALSGEENNNDFPLGWKVGI
jgi:hypothetical protein